MMDAEEELDDGVCEEDVPLTPDIVEAISIAAEPPKQTSRIELIEEDDNAPIPPDAMLQDKGADDARSSVEKSKRTFKIIDEEEDEGRPTHLTEYEDNYEDVIAKKNAKEDEMMNQTNDLAPPLPPARVAALYEQMVEDNEGTDEKVLEKLQADQTTSQTHHNVPEVTPSQSTQQLQSQRSAPATNRYLYPNTRKY